MTGAYRLQRVPRIDRPRGEVLALFGDAHDLERMTPPLLRLRILRPQPIAMQPMLATAIATRAPFAGFEVKRAANSA